MNKLATILDRALGAPRPAKPAPRPRSWPGLYLGVGPQGPVFGGPQHHALVIGPPRVGKTTRLVNPNVIFHPGPAVITSTKPDVLAATIPWRAARGRCYLWDPTGTTPCPPGVEPLRWSPLLGCEDWDVAVARTHILAVAARPQHQTSHEPHWVERAQALLAPLLHAAALAEADIACVLTWLHLRDLRLPLDVLGRHRSHLAASVLQGIAVVDPREQSGIFSTADSLLAAYRTNAAVQAARQADFDPDHFAAGNDTVYICAPSTAQAQHAALVVALLDHIRAAAYRRRRYPAMLWALDELAHVAPLPDLPATIAEGGSQGLLVLACLQDLSQARTRWGPAADGFLTLFGHTLVLPGVADLTTLRHISALAGDTDIPYKSVSRPAGILTRPTVTTHMERRPRLPIDQIAHGDPNMALLLTRGWTTTVGLPLPVAPRNHP